MGSNFCNQCGTELSAPAGAADAQHSWQAHSRENAGLTPSIVRVPEAERRHITVMFIDLVGSTKLSTQLDPEDLRDVIRHYQSLCTKQIADLDGRVAQYLGDGLLAYFGWPQAHEGSAERAVRAGLAIVRTISALKSPSGESLAARVGVETGLVVVGDLVGEGTAQVQAAVGQTPNMAARLQELAPPNSVVIGEQAARLVRASFELEALGSHLLKGLAKPMPVHRVYGESRAASRFDRMTAVAGMAPLVGRANEVAVLLRCWEQAERARGQAVQIVGEAGIGKSRLSRALTEHLDNRRCLQQFYQCSPYHTNSAFYPIISNLENGLRFERDTQPGAKLERLEEWISEAGGSVENMSPLFAPVLSIPTGDRYPPLALSPQRQKEKTIEAWVKLLLARARQHPVLCVFEDLHWSDPTTLEAIDHLVKQLSDASVLVVMTYRPEFFAPWATRDIVTSVNLSRLITHESEEIVTRVTGGKALPAEVLEQIISKTDGVPLFVEELTKTVLESGLVTEEGGTYRLVGQLAQVAIPSTLQDSLMARLDRLAPVKQIAQVAAAIGREFSYDLLEAVASMKPVTLREGLSQLLDAELIYPKELPPHATYIFKHALVQDAAYQSLLKSRRLQIHRHIAEMMIKTFPETVETQPEMIAHHYTEAGLSELAVVYWQRAGQRSVERSAYVEGINYLHRVLELLGDLPNTAERIKRESDIQISLARAWTATKGYVASETDQAYSRAFVLSQQSGDPHQYFLALTGLWAVNSVRGELVKAREMAEQLFRMAQKNGDLTCLETGHRTLGFILTYSGHLTSARTHLEQAMLLYKPRPTGFRAYFGLTDAEVLDRCHLAIVLWPLGFPNQALEQTQQAIARAKELSHPYSIAYALTWDAYVHVLRRNWDTALQRAEESILIATEQKLTYMLALAMILRGVSVAMQWHEHEEGGIGQIIQSLKGLRSAGASLGQNTALAQLVYAYWKAGRTKDGHAALAELMALINRHGSDWWECEMLRLSGELELQRDARDPRRAENYFQQALVLARRDQAKSWELRVAISLSRLWKQQSQQQKAHRLLSKVYGSIPEGFDSGDLKEAKALLEELT